jgi:SAM-dependent methyltransferase
MKDLDTKQIAIDQHSRQAEEFAARYRSFEEDSFRDCFLYSRRRLDLVLRKHLPVDGHGLRLLDVGCGTGNQLAKLREVGFDVAGIDGSAEMLVHARSLNPGADIQQADVESIPFPAATFDYVLCIEVFRYLKDPTPCMREIARVLKPGGTCLVTAAPLFNLNAYWLVNRLAGLLPVQNLVRLRQYFTTSRRLRANLHISGLAQVEIHGIYIGPINWLQRLAPRLLPGFLKRWEPCDSTLADQWLLREFSNMYLACGRK